jgi:hypothetical protein
LSAEFAFFNFLNRETSPFGSCVKSNDSVNGIVTINNNNLRNICIFDKTAYK